MITITISQSNFEELAKLVVVPHEHYDGMNECPICDTPITEAAIQKIKKLEAKCAEMREAQIKFPDNLSALTVGLVLSFAQAMADKLSAAQIKHGYGDGWAETTHEWPIPECHEALMSHLKKGDPVDVANFCAFLWYHKIGTTDCGKETP